MSIHYWRCYLELQPKCRPSLSHVSIFQKKMSLSHNAASPPVLRVFLLLLEILQLPSQLRSGFQGTVCAVLPHLESLPMTRCSAEWCIKRTLWRSDWNWNHFIMRHYGKCCASKGTINNVKHEPNAVSIHSITCELFLGPGFLFRTFYVYLCLVFAYPWSTV